MKDRSNQKISVLFMLYGILFCVCLITANVLETKQISFGPANMTAGLIVFPVSYIINDVVCEVWGYGRTRLLIWMGFAMNFMFVAFGAIADWIPGAPYWHGQEGFHQIFGLAPRIAGASFLAFICGSFMNAYVMSKMKISSAGKNFSRRAVLSTIFGELTDSIIFFPLALGGVIPWEEMPSLVITQVTLKTLYEILVLPITIRVVKFTKLHDHEDVTVYSLKMNTERENEGLKTLGRKTEYKSDYAPEVLETFQNKHPENDYWVQFNCPEFTSLCPITGQPDFAEIKIMYIPGERMVESKSLKLYLFSFRNHGDFHEDCINIIMKDLVRLMDPKYIEVIGLFTPRGGISIYPYANYGRPGTKYEKLAEQRLLNHSLIIQRTRYAQTAFHVDLLVSLRDTRIEEDSDNSTSSKDLFVRNVLGIIFFFYSYYFRLTWRSR